jgi:hypothetical protein
MNIGDNGNELVETKEPGVLWDFLKV